MSPDEVLVLVASIVAGPGALTLWFFRLSRVTRLGLRSPYIGSLRLLLVASAALLVVVLRTLAAPDVRDDIRYLALYFLLGLAWLRLSEFGFSIVGASVRDDLVERRNGAALPAIAGALLGAVCCYAGGNIGAGPGWWVVVFSAGLATLGLGAVWVFLDRMTNASDRVRIDRDVAAGSRLGALLLATGAIFGRAVAGDWHSAPATVVDFFVLAWPAAGLAVVALAAERGSAPVHALPGEPIRFLPGAVGVGYLVAAAAYIALLGWPA
jgi:uncharacterized membrane protein YjfL (UPF0719 family)